MWGLRERRDPWVYGLGVGEVGSSEVTGQAPGEEPKRMGTEQGDAAPLGSGPPAPTRKESQKVSGVQVCSVRLEIDSCPHELAGQPYPASFLPEPEEGRGSWVR